MTWHADLAGTASSAPEATGSQVTRLLLAWRQDDEAALEQLTPLVYGELRALARRYMRGERAGHPLQTTALVHEAYLRLVGLDLEWQGRVHFFAVAARLMRRVLVDYARERRAAKRGGGGHAVALDEVELAAPELAGGPAVDVIELHDVLERLAALDRRKSQVVELRYFGGLTIDETAGVLEVSHATVERDLKLAKAWLARELGAGGGGPRPAQPGDRGA
jgi:RNA polymerase sigma factor (TIGR02999 family)